MRAVASFTLNLAGALLIVIGSAAIASAQTGSDTCVGLNATIGGTCAPLTNTASANGSNTAFGAQALESNTSGNENAATGVSALRLNTTGGDDTATGAFALQNNID